MHEHRSDSRPWEKDNPAVNLHPSQEAFLWQARASADHVGCTLTLVSLVHAQAQLLKLIQQHNAILGSTVSALASSYGDATIGVLDLYTPYASMAQNKTEPGFAAPLDEPCYGGEEYAMPGTPGLDECSEPDEHLFWDWLHLSTQAHSTLAISLLQGLSGVITNSALLHAQQQTSYIKQIFAAQG